MKILKFFILIVIVSISSEVFSQQEKNEDEHKTIVQNSETLNYNESAIIAKVLKDIANNKIGNGFVLNDTKNKSYAGFGDPCNLNPNLPGCPPKNPTE